MPHTTTLYAVRERAFASGAVSLRGNNAAALLEEYAALAHGLEEHVGGARGSVLYARAAAHPSPGWAAALEACASRLAAAGAGTEATVRHPGPAISVTIRDRRTMLADGALGAVVQVWSSELEFPRAPPGLGARERCLSARYRLRSPLGSAELGPYLLEDLLERMEALRPHDGYSPLEWGPGGPRVPRADARLLFAAHGALWAKGVPPRSVIAFAGRDGFYQVVRGWFRRLEDGGPAPWSSVTRLRDSIAARGNPLANWAYAGRFEVGQRPPEEGAVPGPAPDPGEGAGPAPGAGAEEAALLMG